VILNIIKKLALILSIFLFYGSYDIQIGVVFGFSLLFALLYFIKRPFQNKLYDFRAILSRVFEALTFLCLFLA